MLYELVWTFMKLYKHYWMFLYIQLLGLHQDDVGPSQVE